MVRISSRPSRMLSETPGTQLGQGGRHPLLHACQRRNARRQAEALDASSDLLPSLFDDCRRDNGGRCGRLLHGVAFPSWI
jgi:hypothetical protein